MEKPGETLRFGTLLRDYRLALGWTQATLAEHSGLSVRGIQHLEGGETQPYRYTVEQLAEALRLSADERRIFEGAAAPTPRRWSSQARQPSGPVGTGSPMGTVTLVFVQVAPLPTAQRGLGTALAVGRCLDLIQSCLEGHDGSVVHRSPGDGAYVGVFSQASRAMVAAMQLRDALRSQPEPRLADLRVRVALQTGEAHLWQGEYRGPAIEEGARLLASAGWGQTLLSEATAILARDVLPAPDTSGPQFYDIDDVVSQHCSVQRTGQRTNAHAGQKPAATRLAAEVQSPMVFSLALTGSETTAGPALLARA